jgi:Chalcone isomerase-like
MSILLKSTLKFTLKSLLLATSIGLCSAGALAAVVEIQGVKLEDSMDLRGAKLQLNGAGTRFKGPFKVYVAGLYVGKKGSSLDEIVAQPGPKRVSITMVREIDAGELGKLLTRGIEDNTPKSEFSKLVPGLIKMGQVFSDNKKLVPGDNFTIDWVPGTGTVLTVKGKPTDEPFKEPEFFKAILSLWLGPVPADWKLKDALLNVK